MAKFLMYSTIIFVVVLYLSALTFSIFIPVN
jgi:uncharacterized protein involved in outer membrane biogenesis